MLVLVRLLSPSDYGRMALAQTILAFVSVLSFKTFAPHAMQLRDPNDVDWQSHFTAASLINAAAFLLLLLVAGCFTLITKYAGAALPLALVAPVLLLEVPATLRLTMVQVHHDWARLRLLNMVGSALASLIAVVIAVLGGGVWALAASVVFNVAPAALDLIFFTKWRPTWRLDWKRYRETLRFGLTRAGSAGILSGRQAVEQAMVAGAYNFSTLGLFSRSMGLATLAGGRIGGLVSLALYPVITRADCGSERFRRLAGLMLRGVSWTTIPASVLLAFCAPEIAATLYGRRWAGVVPLLPFAAAQAALGGICWAAYTLLLANNKIRSCLSVDVTSATVGAALVFMLVPLGPRVYLTGLAAMYLLILGMITLMLRKSGGISLKHVGASLFPPLVSCAAASAVLVGARGALLTLGFLPLRLAVEGILFTSIFALALRAIFPSHVRELLEVVPGGRRAARALAL